MERGLGEIDNTLSLPFWDWDDDQGRYGKYTDLSQ